MNEFGRYKLMFDERGSFMTRMLKNRGVFMAAGLLAVMCVALSGCYISSGQSKYANPPGEKSLEKKGPQPVYHDFGDVLIPGEMKVEKRSSFIYRTPGFSAGVLSLKGRVDMNSLVTFFDINMPNDGWRPVSSFRSPRTIMLFNKGNRWCVIGITEREFSTVAEIWVSPTMNNSIEEEGLLR